jgi:hypothetical protein
MVIKKPLARMFFGLLRSGNIAFAALKLMLLYRFIVLGERSAKYMPTVTPRYKI